MLLVVSELKEMLTLPVKVADHYKFSVIFFLLGFILTCWFSLYVVTYKRNDRKIAREFLLALFASFIPARIATKITPLQAIKFK